MYRIEYIGIDGDHLDQFLAAVNAIAAEGWCVMHVGEVTETANQQLVREVWFVRV